MTTTTFPAWFTARQEAAKARFESTPAPKRGDEEWRFSNIKQLDFDGFQQGSEGILPASGTLISRSTGIGRTAAKFIFINDTLVHSELNLPDGIICLPLAEGLVSHGELLEQHGRRCRDRRQWRRVAKEPPRVETVPHGRGQLVG